MDKRLLHYELLYHIVAQGSLTEAAKKLNVSKAYISSQLSEFERTVGCLLFSRDKRKLALTSEGELLLQHARVIVEEKQLAEHSLNSIQHEAKGHIRVTAPRGFSDFFLTEAIPQFLEAYPEISAEFVLTADCLPLGEQQIDVAVRLTHQPPLDWVATKLTNYQLAICASNDYLAQNEPLNCPYDLIHHPALIYSTVENPTLWPFWNENGRYTISTNPRLLSNNHNMVISAAKAHLGIARVPSYTIINELKAGDLTQLFNAEQGPAIPIYAIYQPARSIPQKVRVFIEFLKALFQH